MHNLKVIAEGSTSSIVTLEIGDIPQSKQQLKAFVMTWETKENRWNEPFTVAVRKALKYVKDHSDASVLITKSSSPKFFSNGLDLANPNMRDLSFMGKFGKEVMSAYFQAVIKASADYVRLFRDWIAFTDMTNQTTTNRLMVLVDSLPGK